MSRAASPRRPQADPCWSCRAADAAAIAGLVLHLSELWVATNPTEGRRLLLMVLDAVYVDARDARAVVSIRPKAALAMVMLGPVTQPPLYADPFLPRVAPTPL